MITPLGLYALLALSVLVALLTILAVNLLVLPSVHREPHASGESADPPSVAVLVPARNEEPHIEACLLSLLQQDYERLTVWLYDDGSTDATPTIAARLASRYPHLRVVTGNTEPPQGWLGKAHACHCLYLSMREHLEPDYLLFTDADVRFDPGAVSHLVSAAERRGVGLLSAFPRQLTLSWAERLAVPVLLHWAVYTFLPLPLAFTMRTGPAFAAANGQLMLFRREVYEASGGHEAVRGHILEDVALAREVKRAGYRALLADAGPLVWTRMYDGPAEVWRGYSKNAYAFFGYSPFFLALGILILTVLYLAPLFLAVLAPFSDSPSTLAALAGIQYALGVLPRLLLAWRFHYRALDALLHPLSIVYLLAILLNSAHWAHRGGGTWKGRVPAVR